MKDWEKAIVWFVVMIIPILFGMVISIATGGKSVDYNFMVNRSGKSRVESADGWVWLGCLLEIPWSFVVTCLMYLEEKKN